MDAVGGTTLQENNSNRAHEYFASISHTIKGFSVAKPQIITISLINACAGFTWFQFPCNGFK